VIEIMAPFEPSVSHIDRNLKEVECEECIESEQANHAARKKQAKKHKSTVQDLTFITPGP